MKITLPLFFLILISNIIYSQETGLPQKISLEDCYRIALEKNLDIQFTKKQSYLAESELKTQRGAYYPSADANISYSRHLNASGNGGQSFNIGGIVFNTPGSEPRPNSYSLNAGINYLIFNGFSRENQYDRSKINIDQVNSNNNNTIEQVKQNIYINYLNISLTNQIVKIRKENIEVGKNDLERIKTQYEVGSIPESNVFAQEAELSNRELDLVKAENDFNIAKANMNNILGLNPDMETDYKIEDIRIELSDEEILKYYNENKNIESLIDNALKSRFDLQTSKFNLEKLKLNIEIQKASYYPTLTASSGWNWNNTALADFDIGRSYAGLNLQIPVFQQFRVDYQVDAAQVQYEEALKNYKIAELNVRNNIKVSMLKLQASIKQLEISKKSLFSAQMNYESVKTRFEAGLLQITELTIANVGFVTAQINRASAFYNYLTAKKELEYNVGKY